jgi:putative transposase
MIRSYELRLKPTKTQRIAFDEILRDSRETYNAALSERKEAWKLERKSITLYDQQKELTELRKDPQFAVIGLDIQREPLRRIDRAFKSFFRRCKAGEKPGYPRFKGRDRYTSFAWNRPNLDQTVVRLPNLGHVKFKAHRQWEGIPKQVTIKRVGKKWIGRVACDIGQAPEKCVVSNPVGIDLGVTTLATLSDGSEIQNPRFVRKHATAIERAQKNLARKKRGSKNRLRAKEVARRAYQRMADARKNYCHHVSKQLVETYDLIVHEDLKIGNMTRSAKGTIKDPGKNVRQKSGLNRSIMDAAWGMLIWQIIYKAESAGKWVVPVNPRNTSQMCSVCGAIVRKKLSERLHVCDCGTILGRDHNAAINILALARPVGALSEVRQKDRSDATTCAFGSAARDILREAE